MTAESLALAALRRRPAFSFGRWLEREGVFSWLMVAPPIAFLVALVGYPFFYGIWISLQNRPVAQPGVFIGLDNFIADWHDSVFRLVVVNTFVYTIAATLLKMIGGLGLALALEHIFDGFGEAARGFAKELVADGQNLFGGVGLRGTGLLGFGYRSRRLSSGRQPEAQNHSKHQRRDQLLHHRVLIASARSELA